MSKENRYCKFKHFPWVRYIHRHLASKNWLPFLQYNVPKWECLQTGFTQGLLSVLNWFLGMRWLCSAHTTLKTWLNYILAQLLNYSKSLKKLFSCLLQSHPVSVTSLLLSVLTLNFRNTYFFVPVPFYQTTRQRMQHKFQLNRSSCIISLHISSIHLISALPLKNILICYLFIFKNDIWSSPVINVTVLQPLWDNILINLLLSVSVGHDTVYTIF